MGYWLSDDVVTQVVPDVIEVYALRMHTKRERPTTRPTTSIANAPISVQRGQSTASRYSAHTGGAINAVTRCVYTNSSEPLFTIGIHITDNATTTTMNSLNDQRANKELIVSLGFVLHADAGAYRPTTRSSISEAFLRKKRQISIVKMVLAELNTDVREETRAESATAIIIPRIPVGNSSSKRVRYA